MKVIIPVAGQGRRLRPWTDNTPKSLLNYRGYPILYHILNPLQKLDISEYIFIVGYHGKQIRHYISLNYPDLPVLFVEQNKQKGLGHAIYLARNQFLNNDPLLIILGDVLIQTDWKTFTEKNNFSIGIQRIFDKKPYGVVNISKGQIKDLVEKPESEDLIIAGCYFIEKSLLLFESLENIINSCRLTDGEYQLTDALNLLVSQGTHISIEEVKLLNWEHLYQHSGD